MAQFDVFYKSRLLYGELPYWSTVLVAYLGGTILVAAMTSLSSFATLKTLYILWFDRVNDISDAIIVKAIQGFTVLLTITMVGTEGLVKVRNYVLNSFDKFVSYIMVHWTVYRSVLSPFY